MDWNQKIIEEFRSNKGIVGGQFGSMQLLLLTTKGAKSGKEFTTPVAYTMDNDRYVIAASKGGAPTNPDWYYNLKTDPTVMIEVGDQAFPAVAEEVVGEERDRLYQQHAAKYLGFADYAKQTSRLIPVFTIQKKD